MFCTKHCLLQSTTKKFLDRQFSVAVSRQARSSIRIPGLSVIGSTVESITNVEEAANVITKLIKDTNGKLVVITGAGVSTDSGIPDYRGEQGVYKRNPNHKPILYPDFIASKDFRQRYWVRGYLGWSQITQAKPNPTHYHLTWLLEHGYLNGIITQNVDHLHHDAGAPDESLIELHGTLHRVECLDCNTQMLRNLYQHRIHARNPAWANYQRTLRKLNEAPKINPDGDVDLPSSMSYQDFDIPPCSECSSQRMKPQVVFFGENIRKGVSEAAEKMVEQAKGLLVIGSSLATYSSFRLARLASERKLPVVILNKGPTRADPFATHKIELGCTDVLTRVRERLDQ